MFRLTQVDFFDSNQFISVQPRAPQEPFPEHCHAFQELVLVKSGCAIHQIDGSAVHISRGSVFYLREDDAHMFEQMHNLCLVNILFRPEAFHSGHNLQQILTDSCRPRLGGVLLNPVQQRQSEMLLQQIADEGCEQDKNSIVMIEALFMQLAVLFWRARLNNGYQTKEELTEQERIMGLVSYINENFKDDIDWESLSNRFGIPLRTLNRKIQEYTGLTPGSYVGRTRLCHASWLLSHTQKSITDIAYECGFNDSNYFSSKFSNMFSVTPMQYRKHNGRT